MALALRTPRPIECLGTLLCHGARQPHDAAWAPAPSQHGMAIGARGWLRVSQGSVQPLATGLGSLAGNAEGHGQHPRLERDGFLTGPRSCFSV